MVFSQPKSLKCRQLNQKAHAPQSSLDYHVKSSFGCSCLCTNLLRYCLCDVVGSNQPSFLQRRKPGQTRTTGRKEKKWHDDTRGAEIPFPLFLLQYFPICELVRLVDSWPFVAVQTHRECKIFFSTPTSRVASNHQWHTPNMPKRYLLLSLGRFSLLIGTVRELESNVPSS